MYDLPVHTADVREELRGIFFIVDAVQAFGRISSIMGEDYEGGEFCQGLLFSNEASRIVFKIGNSIMNLKQQDT